MHSEGSHTKLFSRRAMVIGGLQFCALGILGARLAWLQVAQGPRYKMLSDKNRINIKMLPPKRGRVLDRFGVPLAVNKQNFRVLITPEQTQNVEQSLVRLSSLIELSRERIDFVLERVRKTAKFVPIEVRDDLGWKDVAKIEVNLPDLPGLSIDTGQVRSYPYGTPSAHIVGYVGLASQKDLDDDPVFRLPGFKVGKTGVERAFDKELRGQLGTAQVEVNVSGREVRELARENSVQGQDIILSVDQELQGYIQERLSVERSASAVLMDAESGAVYAMASHPSFDPNLFTQGLSAAAWEKLLAMPGYPLTNKAIAGQYPPASTFKMIVALAGLRAGKVTEKRGIHCPGYYEYGGDRFHCWKRGGHGHVDVYSALAKSCDVYFYDLALEIGIEKIAEMAREFGLGQVFNFDLLEERPGLVPDKDWKMGYFGEHWRVGETIVASIGQGYLQSTPLQLAVMTARMVNGGHAVEPWLVQNAHKDVSLKSWSKMNIHPWHLKMIKRGMDEVVNKSTGTAYKSRIEEAAYRMGGKTGTAQVRKITAQQRSEGIKNDDMPWKHRDHGLFVGYAPVSKPRYVCSVIVEHGGGSVSAVPIARDLLYRAQKRQPEKAVFEAKG